MNHVARISINQMWFTTVPAQRVTEISAALDAQRVNRRTAPAGSIDEDTARRNIADLETALERAEENLQAHTDLVTRLDRERQAERDASTQRALKATVDQLRTRYLASPGATVEEFDEILPDLLKEQRKQAVLNAPEVFAQQVAEARQRLGPVF
jgi:hypothetical protein